MAQFATHSELESRLGVTLTASEETRAGALLTTASGLIQQEARQQIELVEDDVLTRRGTREGSLLLPERPVISVASITVNGTALDADSWYLEGDELVRRSSFPDKILDESSGGRWGSGTSELVITYTHGYDPIPDGIKAICLEMVVRAWVNPGAVVSERYGSESVVYAQGGDGSGVGLVLTKAEARSIRRAVGRRSEAVSIR